MTDRSRPRPSVKPKSRDENIGDQNIKTWRQPPYELDWGQTPTERKTNRKAMADRLRFVVGTQRREDIEAGLRTDSVEYVLDYLIDEGYADSYKSALAIVECMSEQWFGEIVEANRWERYKEERFKQSEKELPGYRATKDIAMMKARRREGDYSRGATHPNARRETPYSKSGTHAHSQSLKNQRVSAHRDARKIKRKRPGTTPEERATTAILRKHGIHDPGRMEGMNSSERTQLKGRLTGQRDRRRSLRSNAIRSLGRSLGWAHVDNQGLN